MPIINMNTGKVLVTDKQLMKDVKKFLASKTDEEWAKIIKEEYKSLTEVSKDE